MKTLLRRIADRLQRIAARSSLVVRAAVAVRNQCRCVIKYHLAESPDLNATGEVWLRAAAVPGARTFIDAGANVGDWLAGAVAIKGADDFTAIAYEPSSSAFARLRERFAADPRIELCNAALGDRSGEIAFHEEPDAGRGSSALRGFGSSKSLSTRRVEVRTLDDEAKRLHWDHIGFLKIDAEGYDLRVLAGARGLLARQAIGVLQFEYNRSWQLAGDTLYGAMQLLQSFGYDVFVLKRDGLYTLDYERYEEYYEYSNYCALSPAYAHLKAAHYRGTI